MQGAGQRAENLAHRLFQLGRFGRFTPLARLGLGRVAPFGGLGLRTRRRRRAPAQLFLHRVQERLGRRQVELNLGLHAKKGANQALRRRAFLRDFGVEVATAVAVVDGFHLGVLAAGEQLEGHRTNQVCQFGPVFLAHGHSCNDGENLGGWATPALAPNYDPIAPDLCRGPALPSR